MRERSGRNCRWPMTNVLKELATRRRKTLQAARNADAILDHLEQMIHRTAGLGRIARIQGMGLQYWRNRINVVVNEINLFSSQKLRANLLLVALRSFVRP